MRLATAEEPSQPSLYMERAPLKKKRWSKSSDFEITNAHWNRIVRYLMTKYQQEFYEFPAAKRNHHAFANGLAYTLSQCCA